jgi:hypothetical protein
MPLPLGSLDRLPHQLGDDGVLVMTRISDVERAIDLIGDVENDYPRKSSWTVVRARPAWCPARRNEAK